MVPQVARAFPFEQEFTEALHGRRVFILLPNEDERDALHGFEQDETEGGTGRHDGFRHDPDASARFHVTQDRADQTRRVRETWRDAGAPTAGDDSIVQPHAFTPGEHDERFTSQRRPRDESSFRKRMKSGHHDAQSFLAQNAGAQSESFVRRNGARDGGGQSAFGNHFPDTFRRAFFEVNSYEWITLAILSEQSTEEWLRGRADVTETKFAFLTGSGAPDAANRFLPMLQQQFRFTHKHLAGGRQAHLMPRPLEDTRTQRRFQLFDGATQGRLRNMQPPGGPREAQVLGDGLKISEMPQFHSVARDNITASR